MMLASGLLGIARVAVVAVDHEGIAPRGLWRPRPRVFTQADHEAASSNWLVSCVGTCIHSSLCLIVYHGLRELEKFLDPTLQSDWLIAGLYMGKKLGKLFTKKLVRERACVYLYHRVRVEIAMALSR